MKDEFLTKAKENIAAAELLFDNKLYNASANRAYYNTELIYRRKVYPSRLKSYLKDLQDKRNRADYKAVFLSKTVASRQLRHAQEFVDIIKQEIEK